MNGNEVAKGPSEVDLDAAGRFVRATDHDRQTGNGKIGALERRRLMQNPSRKYFRGPDWSHQRHYEP